MPGNQVLLVAIAVITVIAIALLISPAFVWIRTRFFGHGKEEPRQLGSDATIEVRPALAAATNGVMGQNGTPDEEEAATPGAPVLVDEGAHRDHTVRIVSWAFLMAVAVFAAASGIWVATLPAIVVLVAVTGEAMLVLQDILPATRLRRARGPLQAILAIAFASVLVALTGGLESPFTFTFPLIVGAGALLTAPRIAVLLTLVAAAAYLTSGLIGSPEPPTGPLVQLLVLSLIHI